MRKMSALQKKYFGKGHHSHKKGRKVMAKKKGKRFGRARTFGKGNVMGNALDGVIVGVAQAFIPDDALFGMADPLVAIGVGWFRGNPTLVTLGGIQAGAKIPNLLSGGLLGTRTTGGGVY